MRQGSRFLRADCRWLPAVVLASLTFVTWGQSRSPSIAGRIDEEFSSRVNANYSSSVVGVIIGNTPTPLDLQEIGVRLPNTIRAKTLCFSATTSDGRYSAKGVLDVNSNSLGQRRIEAESFSKYGKELARYPAGSFTGMTTLSTDCLGAVRKSLILPLSFGTERKNLVVAINSASAHSVAAKLKWGKSNTEEISANCGKVKAETTAFDRTCQFDLAVVRADRPIDLLIEIQPRSAPPREERYSIQVGL